MQGHTIKVTQRRRAASLCCVATHLLRTDGLVYWFGLHFFTSPAIVTVAALSAPQVIVKGRLSVNSTLAGQTAPASCCVGSQAAIPCQKCKFRCIHPGVVPDVCIVVAVPIPIDKCVSRPKRIAGEGDAFVVARICADCEIMRCATARRGNRVAGKSRISCRRHTSHSQSNRLACPRGCGNGVSITCTPTGGLGRKLMSNSSCTPYVPSSSQPPYSAFCGSSITLIVFLETVTWLELMWNPRPLFGWQLLLVTVV